MPIGAWSRGRTGRLRYFPGHDEVVYQMKIEKLLEEGIQTGYIEILILEIQHL